MTEQQLFNRVARHLLNQNARSEQKIVRHVFCRFRTADGKKCAIGCLIPDDRYERSFEVLAITSPVIRAAAGITDKTAKLASMLVGIHDLCPVKDWHMRLHRVAVQFGLNTKVLEDKAYGT